MSHTVDTLGSYKNNQALIIIFNQTQLGNLYIFFSEIEISLFSMDTGLALG